MKCVVGFVMFYNMSCHSLQCSCLSVFKVAIIAVSLLQLLSTPRMMTDVELLAVDYYSPPPTSIDESDDEYKTALKGEQEEEEEEEVRTCVVNWKHLQHGLETWLFVL